MDRAGIRAKLIQRSNCSSVQSTDGCFSRDAWSNWVGVGGELRSGLKLQRVTRWQQDDDDSPMGESLHVQTIVSQNDTVLEWGDAN